MLHLQAILESHNKRQHIAPAALTRNKLLARVAGVMQINPRRKAHGNDES